MKERFNQICSKYPWVKKARIEVGMYQMRVFLINQNLEIRVNSSSVSIREINTTEYLYNEELSSLLLEKNFKYQTL